MKIQWILSCLVFAGLMSELQAQQSPSKEETEKEFKDSVNARLKALESKNQESKNQDSKTGKEKDTKDAWWDRITLYGDFRFRYDHLDTETATARDRARIRARVGLDAKINDNVDFNFRLSTDEPGTGGGGDPIAANQSLTGSFSKKSIWLDIADIDWHPVSNFHVIGGKMLNPFFMVGNQELIWDVDLTPEGVAFKWENTMDGMRVFANGGGFWLRETAPPVKADMGMFGGQVGVQFDLGSDSKATVGYSHYEYINEDGQLVFSDSNTAGTNAFGNTTTGTSPNLKYSKEYRINEIFADYSLMAWDTPLKFVGDFVQNGGTSSQNKAYLAGFELGKIKDPGSWAFRYNYRKVQKDAVVGAFCDSDSGGGGTNHKGHKFQGEYLLAKRFSLVGTFFHDKNNLTSANEVNYERFMLDFVVKF